MITVEDVLKKDAKKQAKANKENEKLLATGEASAKTKKSLFWPIIGITAAGIAVYLLFFRKKNDAGSEGMVNT